MQGENIKLEQNCPATLIPAGDEVILKQGSEYHVSQALGGSVTLRDSSGLFRVSSTNLHLIGPEFFNSAVEEPQIQSEGELNEDDIWNALKQCFDPEIPVNIVDLGLIYDLRIVDYDDGTKGVDVKMTLTATGCGMGPTIAADAQSKIEALPNISKSKVEIVWEPAWNPRMISEEGKAKLGLE